MFADFLSPDTSLKICGVTTLEDAEALVNLGVAALGLNFWPQSKRYCSPEDASTIASHIAGDILRVGVFVNNAQPLAVDLFDECLIDVVQLHGDESEADIHFFLEQGIPLIRAVSATNLPRFPLPEKNFALLVDTPAGQEYGGTGKTFDWSLAREFIAQNPQTPVILAGGITPDNAAEAVTSVHPTALDVASGAESSPGHKDLAKVRALMNALS